MNTLKCEWCGHRIKAKRSGPAAHYCSASCRQRAYERRLLQKQKQAEADAVNATLPRWATHMHVKPKLPTRRRPTRLKCPVCRFPYAVNKRGPIPLTCSHRCAFALALYKAYRRGQAEPFEVMKKDLAASMHLDDDYRRRKARIDEMLAGIDKRKTQR